MIPGYDSWKTTPPDDPDPVDVCDRCGCGLYAGDYITVVDGEKLCDDCLNDDYRRMLYV